MNKWILVLVFVVAVVAFLWLRGGGQDVDVGAPAVSEVLSDKAKPSHDLHKNTIAPALTAPDKASPPGNKPAAGESMGADKVEDNVMPSIPLPEPVNDQVDDMIITEPDPANDMIITESDPAM